MRFGINIFIATVIILFTKSLGLTALTGDINNDGTVNSIDWGIMNSQWFTSGPEADLNGDGLVNSIDFGLMNANWGKTEDPSAKLISFTGVFGGSFQEVLGTETISTWANSNIIDFMSDVGLNCDSCDPNNIEDLRIIANHNIGGLTALGFFVHRIGGIESSINTPGNADILRANIDLLYRDHPNLRIFLAGHSAGGGDVQDLLEKLKILDIPVEMSGHIDSIEIGDDASIPNNTHRAMGFYQKDGSVFGEFTEGEDNLHAEDEIVTIVSNTKINEPQGPDDPESDPHAYHRNMDNDERVWEVILNYLKKFID